MAEPTPQQASSNFSFLKEHDSQLVRLGALAERYFKNDPSTSLIKVRQFAELIDKCCREKKGLRGFVDCVYICW